MSYFQARVQLMRPGNGLMAAIGVILGGYLVVPDLELVVWPAALAAFLLTGFGNVLNDLNDQEIDKLGHPERPLVTGAIKESEAKAFAVLLLGIGLLEAYLAAGTPTLLFALFNVGILALYEKLAKKRGLPGNFLVGLLVGTTFLFGALATQTPWQEWGMVAALAVMAMLVNVARELQKDVQDRVADVNRATLVRTTGEGVALGLAVFLTHAAVGLSAVAFWYAPWSNWWGIPLLLAGIVFVVGSAYAWLNASVAQASLKLGMLLALVAFALGPTL